MVSHFLFGNIAFTIFIYLCTHNKPSCLLTTHLSPTVVQIEITARAFVNVVKLFLIFSQLKSFWPWIDTYLTSFTLLPHCSNPRQMRLLQSQHNNNTIKCYHVDNADDVRCAASIPQSRCGSSGVQSLEVLSYVKGSYLRTMHSPSLKYLGTSYGKVATCWADRNEIFDTNQIPKYIRCARDLEQYNTPKDLSTHGYPELPARMFILQTWS